MKATMNDIRELVALQLGMSSVQANDRIIEDLGAESADIVNIIVAMEEKYKITIEEEELRDIQKVSDLFDRVGS